MYATIIWRSLGSDLAADDVLYYRPWIAIVLAYLR